MAARTSLAVKVLVSVAMAVALTGCNSVIQTITAQEAFDLVQSNEGNPEFVIVDVRTPDEFAEGHLENAINIDFNADSFRDNLNQLDKSNTYLIYCRTGNRSARALATMDDLGFSDVHDMGGIRDWTAEGFPVVE